MIYQMIKNLLQKNCSIAYSKIKVRKLNRSKFHFLVQPKLNWEISPFVFAVQKLIPEKGILTETLLFSVYWGIKVGKSSGIFTSGFLNLESTKVKQELVKNYW